MKIRIVFILLLTLLLAILIDRNQERLYRLIVHYTDPVKTYFVESKKELLNAVDTYFNQADTIQNLRKENRTLKVKLSEEMHFLRQLHEVYTALPQLKKMPVHNIALTQTISYAKLGDFSHLILTRPKNLQENRLYGLMQNGVAAGIATLQQGQLNAYLNSNPESRFSVYIGKHKAPGVAVGEAPKHMRVKFIPKWYEIKPGDTVSTAGLDGLFYRGIPVGKVSKVETESAYKVAEIETFDDPYHPDDYFLITDANVSLLDMYDPSMSHIYERLSPLMNLDPKIANIDESKLKSCLEAIDEFEAKTISSIPARIDQTRADTIQPEAPLEEIAHSRGNNKKKKRKVHKKRKKRAQKHRSKKVRNQKPAKKPSTLDLF